MTTDPTPNHWAFYIHGSGSLLSCSGTWSSSTFKNHFAMKELQAVVLMLCKVAFWLSGKVFAFCLENTTAKAYLCNQGGTAYPFPTRIVCHILNLPNKHCITHIPAYIPTHLNVEANYLSQGRLVPEWHLLCIAQAVFNFGVN